MRADISKQLVFDKPTIVFRNGEGPISASDNNGSYSRAYEKNGYLITVSTILDLEILEQDWKRLENSNQVPFFLTWHWVSCWIKTYLPEVIVVSASHEGRLVATGLFTSSLEHRYGLIRARQLRLHQMGNVTMDQIWMEYNDFICDSRHKADAVHACLEVLQQGEFDWDEIVLPMLPSSRAEYILSSEPMARIGLRNLCYAVDLARMRETNQDYLPSLTANSRYQIRRSMRLYEKRYGALQLSKAETPDQALEFFHDAGEFHLARWRDSGFNNRHFVEFHQNLIRDSFSDGVIDMLKLKAGDQTIAVMYYQIVGKKVFFYLHGLRFDTDGKLKPGLVAHAMATEYYIRQGMDQYDYMGGDNQYKIQLAQRTEDLITVIIQRPRFQFQLERIARNIKRRMLPKND